MGTKKALFSISLLFALGIFPALGARAAPIPMNGAVIGWSASTFVPPVFQGKILPTAASPISAWVSVFKGGRLIDSSGYTVRWYADAKLIQSGRGLVSISFKAPGVINKIMNLQARVQDPSGQLFVVNTQVPIMGPRVAVETASPGGILSGASSTLRAITYFFNAPNANALNFKWTANNISGEGSENPQEAVLVFDDAAKTNSTVRIGLEVSNPNDGTTAKTVTNFIYQR